jgi:filamentous hemagglutinin
LAGIEISPVGNASTPTLAQLESEFAVSVAPSEFANLASTAITADQARSILSGMGVTIPSHIGVGDITPTLQVTPRLTPAQIQQFLQQAQKLSGH